MKLKITAKDSKKNGNIALLEDSGFMVAQSFTLSRDRGSETKDTTIDLESTDVLGMELEDGTVWYAAEEDVMELFDLTPNRGGEGEAIVLPDNLKRESERGLKSFFIKAYHHFKRKEKKVAGQSAKQIAALIEKNIKEGVRNITDSFDLTDFDKKKIDQTKPVLLFLHGTASSTEGSFGEMKGTETWGKLYQKYQQNILGFDHRTWSKSPLQNALDVLTALPDNCKLHLVSHSRGGLIGDILCRCTSETAKFSIQDSDLLTELDRAAEAELLSQLNELATKKKIKVEKFIRTACPASGTTFLSKRLDHFFNILLNLIPKVGNPFADYTIKGLKSLVLQTVGERNNPAILPGLEAMVPDSPILKILNNPQVETSTYVWVIAGKAGGSGVFKTLACILAQLYYRMDNDFVVDTDSMFMGALSKHKRHYKFVKGSNVSHFSYFKNKETRDTLFSILGNDNPEKVPANFKEIIIGEQNREVNIPGGLIAPKPFAELSRTKPLLILLPGIMGSNLGTEDDEVWLDLSDLMFGGIDKMKMSYPNLAAKGIVASAYEQLVTYAQEKEEWEVLVFPFDWRASITTAGKALAEVIQKIIKRNPKQQIALMGHSMGGLVIRDLIFNHKAEWEKLVKKPNFRCMLLGTPWKGSFHIPELILGKGKRMRSLNRLVYYRTKKNLLSIFTQYPGLFELLPIESEGATSPFSEGAFWELLEKIAFSKNWTKPKQALLANFEKYRKQINAIIDTDFAGSEKVYYIAGKSGQTFEQMEFRVGTKTYGIDEHPAVQDIADLGTIRPRYQFISTEKGDGSVPWSIGIPTQLPENNVYYVDTPHGELANDKQHFKSYFELLENGNTYALSRQPIQGNRSEEVLRDSSVVLSNDPADLLRGVLGLPIKKQYQGATTVSLPPLQVKVINGDLRYNKRAVMIGHFEADGIVSAEKVMDLFLNGKLVERRSLGIYPGPIGSHWVYQSQKDNKSGVIIVGLGRLEDLTPYELSNTIEKACLGYLSSRENDVKDKYELSSLLIGSGYAGLSIASSIQAILEGVDRANKKIRTEYPDNPIIEGLSFIELYQEKAITAFSILDTIQQSSNFNFELKHPLKSIGGKRVQMPIDDSKNWWNRFTVEIKEEQGKLEKIAISAATGKAGVGKDELEFNSRLINEILNEKHKEGEWNKERNRTAYELMMPKNLKSSLKSQPNVIWVLDKAAAKYPWELFLYDENNGVPHCTKAGMIRQLTTSHLDKNINLALSKRALIIGDPELDKSNAGQLPGARKEAIMVEKQLDTYGFSTNLSLNEYATTIISKLFEEYKIIHVASHGVLKYGPKQETGILLSNGFVITPQMINQRMSTPELVFINCCHLGDVAVVEEEYTRSRHQLAANIGTQLIENGVRAVVVAGWAINDNAAKLFAEVFYENLLNGENFGDAVRKARESCYNKHPHHNTWGAFQCYGDPFYQLKAVSTKSRSTKPYILEKEVLIDLEILLNQADSAVIRKEKVNLVARLANISNRIEASGIKVTAAILEKEAAAYAQLNLLEQAINKYEQLFKMEQAHYVTKNMEIYCNTKMKLLLKEKINDEAAVKDVLDKLKALLLFGATAERFRLCGSAYKRQAMLLEYPKPPKSKKYNGPPVFKKKVLVEMTDAYKNAVLLKFEKPAGTAKTRLSLAEALNLKIHGLENWLIGEGILRSILDKAAGRKREKNILSIFPTRSILVFLKAKMAQLEKGDQEGKKFWDFIELVNMGQCYLMYCKPTDKEYQPILAKIKTTYNLAWKRGGTVRNLETEITQMQFIINQLPATGDEKLVACFQELLVFFQEKL